MTTTFIVAGCMSAAVFGGFLFHDYKVGKGIFYGRAALWAGISAAVTIIIGLITE